jgi:hypothetical protein
MGWALVGCLTLALAAGPAPAVHAAATADATTAPKLVSGQGRLVVAGAGGTVSHELPTGLVFEQLEATADGWVAAGVGGGSRLVVVEETTAGMTVLDRVGPDAPRVAFPRPLVADGRLTGLAWQAGAGRSGLGVLYAPWDGATWGAPETVAAAEPGTSRLALAAVPLADGSVLAAWAQVDSETAGGDDEIFWSQRTHHQGSGHWSTPARLGADDSVPDVTPTLLATADGALAVWTAFDPQAGKYRLEIARFSLAGTWSEPAALTAPGAIFPAFETSALGPVVTYRDAAAGAWGALLLDAETPRVIRKTLLPAGSAGERPVLLGAGEEGARWAAPGDSGTKRATVATPWEVVR